MLVASNFLNYKKDSSATDPEDYEITKGIAPCFRGGMSLKMILSKKVNLSLGLFYSMKIEKTGNIHQLLFPLGAAFHF